RPSEPTKKWYKILDSVSISDWISENNKESLQLIGIKAKGEFSPIGKNRIANTFKNDTSATKVVLLCNRRKANLEKLIKDTERVAPILPSLFQ
ncbi:34001_t:CDS:2, partial [Gigaspora margarita]